MTTILSCFILTLSSISSFAQSETPQKVMLQNAKLLSTEVMRTDSQDDMMSLGSEAPLPEVVATLETHDGKKYTLNFPFGIGKNLIGAYVQSKGTFYVDEAAVYTRVSYFYEFESKNRVAGKELHNLSLVQQSAVRNEYLAQADSIPLRSQPMGLILNFVFESSLK